jgi:hypothetical protein
MSRRTSANVRRRSSPTPCRSSPARPEHQRRRRPSTHSQPLAKQASATAARRGVRLWSAHNWMRYWRRTRAMGVKLLPASRVSERMAEATVAGAPATSAEREGCQVPCTPCNSSKRVSALNGSAALHAANSTIPVAEAKCAWRGQSGARRYVVTPATPISLRARRRPENRSGLAQGWAVLLGSPTMSASGKGILGTMSWHKLEEILT